MSWRAALALVSLCGCGPAIVDHSPASNALDPDTATLEGGLGQWVAWYSSRIARDAAAARTGSGGLRITVTDPFGWGVALDNWPGFAARPGLRRASFWARVSQGNEIAVELRISWRDAAGNELGQRSLVTPPLGSAWVKSSIDLTAPAGTERVTLEVSGPEGSPGDVIDVDDVAVFGGP